MLLRSTLLILFATACVRPAPAQLCGDCDLSGAIDILDALAGARHAVLLSPLSGQGFDNCDVDAGGTVNVLDAVQIAHVVSGFARPLTCLQSASFQITEVSFDWSTTVADGHGLRVDRTTDVMVPEWRPASGRNEPALFLGGATPTIEFRVTATPTSVTQSTFRFTTQLAGGGASPLGDSGDVTVTFAGGVSGPVRIPFSQPVPVAVDKLAVEIEWLARDTVGFATAERVVETTGPHTIYTTLGAPVAPWQSSGTYEPWTRALDYAVSWAGGATTADAALDLMTPPFRDNYGMQYDIVQGAPGYTSGFGWNLDLSLMLDRMDTQSMGRFCCYDPARALAAFGNLVGGDYRFWFLDSPSGFFVNCIDLNGRGWTNSPFYGAGGPMIYPPDAGPPRWAFGNHAFTGVPGGAPPAVVWDGTFAGDGDANPDEPPHVRTDMISLPWSLYGMITIDDNPFRSTATPYVIPFDLR